MGLCGPKDKSSAAVRQQQQQQSMQQQQQTMLQQQMWEQQQMNRMQQLQQGPTPANPYDPIRVPLLPDMRAIPPELRNFRDQCAAGVRQA
eukprot:CAMPEP_0202904974 /NCGR_PEP_ID=MMETSP1392-20130828/31957_1 /ASSEMBLY_ACC=CAM_ASM_000868 /TAXON_ID=225041 /ORGANISM="Chlamydomonas chlamydogama, Strain SAG 11-48b" /LENGTH=89 /DNA_ID=CAMNT_0049592871 /DNA_START=89 /DNA_END=355 /DNA_ORIENTATION=-